MKRLSGRPRRATSNLSESVRQQLKLVRSGLRLAVLVWLAAWGMQGSVFSQTITATWTAGSKKDHNWSDAKNWDCGQGRNCVPNGSKYNAILTNPDSNLVNQNIDVTLNNLTMQGDAGDAMGDGIELQLVGDTLNGTINMNNDGGTKTLLFISGKVTYAPTIGVINMNNNSQIVGEETTLTNQGDILYGQTAKGAMGTIGGLGLTLRNSASGSVDFVSGNTTLELLPSPSWTNDGTIQNGTSSGQVLIKGGTITQAQGGQIVANPGTVVLDGVNITGGTLAGSSGIFQASMGPPPTLQNLTLAAGVQYQIGNRTDTNLVGTITNLGTISLRAAGGAFANLDINSPATLTGSGSVLLGGPNNIIDMDAQLSNQQTISGVGEIDVGSARLINQGTISAGPGANGGTTLQVKTSFGRVNNNGGTITTNTNNCTVEISGGKIANAGGTISSGTGVALLDNDVTIEGGTVAGGGSAGGYVEGKLATLDGSSSPVTITGLFNVLDGDVTTLKGQISDATANIVVSGTNSEAVLDTKGPTVLQGGGTVSLEDEINSLIKGGGNKLENKDNTIQGQGKMSDIDMVNDLFGTVSAGPAARSRRRRGPGNPGLILDSTTSFKNLGTVSVLQNGVLIVEGKFSNFNATTNTFSGGIWNVNGTFQFNNANIVNNAANLTLAGQIVDQNGANALLNFSNNSSKGVFTVSGGQTFTTSGTFANAGKLIVAQNSGFSVGGSGTNYNQTGGKTTVDGTLSVPIGGAVDITGGTLEGAGTAQGSVAMGGMVQRAEVLAGKTRIGKTLLRPSTTPATFIIGDSKTQSGLFTVTNNYSQLSSGVMDVQIGGTTAGTQYSQLNVTGATSLNGTLNIARINKFLPQVGQQFTVLNSTTGVSGTFSTVNGTKINSKEHFAISYNSNSVVLTAETGP